MTPKRKIKRLPGDRNRRIQRLLAERTSEADEFEESLPPDVDAIRDWPVGRRP